MKTPKPNDLVESKLRGHNKHCRLQRNCRGNVAVVYHIFCFFNRLNPVEGFQKSSCPDHNDAFQTITVYSSVPNRRVGRNKCAGGKIHRKH